MPNNLDSRNVDALTGAVYFVVGRGTEGGHSSYQLSVAGVSRSEWGQVSAVAQNSGYSLGAIQVDLGQRGTWPLGATEGRALRDGETTYVDAVIAQSSAYAARNGLSYTSDHAQLRADLLTHGNGRRGRTSISFIDEDTRDSINAWASSVEGKQWIHRNIDYAQVRNATETAINLLDRYPNTVAEDRRFETISVLAKTANQYPGYLQEYECVLRNGGGYDDIVQQANALRGRNNVYAGDKAGLIAETYRSAYEDPARQAAIDRAHEKVSNPNFDPSSETSDPDILAALGAIGQRARGNIARDPVVEQVQRNLNALGVRDARGELLMDDGNRGGPRSHTNEAIAAFQQQFGFEGQMSNAELLAATQAALNARRAPGIDQALAGAPQAAPAAPAPQRGDPATTPRVSAGPAALPPLSTTQTLEHGDHGAAVKALQQHLQLIGARDRDGQPIKDDRDYGDRTKEAVEQFQLWTGRETTGIADPDTLKALQIHAQFAARQQAQGMPRADRLADNLKPAAPDLADAAELRSMQERNALQDPAAFEQGRTIAIMQTGLIQLGYHQRLSQPLQVNGVNDEATRQAVTAFQAQHNLPMTGSADAATQQMLQQALLAQQQADDKIREQEQANKAPTQAKEQLPVSHPDHPDHKLLEKIREGVRGLNQQLGKAWDESSDRLSASLLVAAKEKGWTGEDRIDMAFSQATERGPAGHFVHMARTGDNVSVDPFHNRASVVTDQACAKPVEESYQQVQAISVQQELERQQALARGPDDPSRGGPTR